MRQRLARSVLVVGTLTMLATSAPTDYEINNSSRVAGTSRVRVTFSPAAAGDTMMVVFAYDGVDSATVTPDPGFLQPAYLLVRDQPASYDVAELCADGCELFFTVETAPFDATYVEASSQREGDASFCFPENREFDADATIEVAVVP